MMILRTLKHQPLHGYALAQHIKSTSPDLLQVEEGSLYPALQRLLKDALELTRCSSDPTVRGCRRRLYSRRTSVAHFADQRIALRIAGSPLVGDKQAANAVRRS